MLDKIIKKLQEALSESPTSTDRVILLDPDALGGGDDPELRILGLFSDVEQEKIAEILTSLDDQIEAVESKLVQLESLKKSLMGDLLTGRVRVSVD